MPSVSGANLTLTTVNNQVTIRVQYNVTFNKFDRQLSGLGKTWHSHVTVHGMDGATVGPNLANLPRQTFAVTVGNTNQVIAADRSVTVARSVLQEDPAVGDNDELKAKIRIHSPEPMDVFTPDVFTDQEILFG
ncbi:Uncharacterised protein [Kocuria rosea]|uniref:hypothetical protein n=1 Tax=Kocuria rosea TaxID=1275 RepID=UPI000F71F285|nr:hypothetical protein [Kocuria rosea]VEH41210.1 Uncharacterised protein [Kocuria rosea]